MNQHPLHSDAHYAQTHTQHKQRVVLGPLVFSVVIGMTVADISGRAIANLEVERAQAREAHLHRRHALRGSHGARAAGVERRATAASSPSRPRASTSAARPVCSYTRKVLVPKKSHATLGEGRLPVLR